MVSTAPFPYLENAPVSAIMENQRNEWDYEFIRDIFIQSDVDLITSIPLPQTPRTDKLIWDKESNGNFSVRSCYRALLGDYLDDDRVSWAGIWKVEIPPKVKMFFWQACSGCLPTNDKLGMKRVDCPSLCQVCLQDDEDSNHALISCGVARTAWSILNQFIPLNTVDSFEVWIGRFLNQLSKEIACMFVMFCWSIWVARNEKVWENKTSSAHLIANRAICFLQEWRHHVKLNPANMKPVQTHAHIAVGET